MRQKLYLPPYSVDLTAARRRRYRDQFSEASALTQQRCAKRVLWQRNIVGGGCGVSHAMCKKFVSIHQF
jgi:uncharacterized membrane protein YsdA (DUF1294 family)